MIVRSALFALLAVSLVACSTVPDKPLQGYMLADMQSLQQQQNWRLEGRLAVSDERDSVSASIRWQHRPESDEIELIGPLSQGRVLLAVSADSVMIDEGDGRRVYSGRGDEVLAEQLGMEMPVYSLRYWVLGVNDPAQTYEERKGGFSQAGWLVMFREMQQVNAKWLPKKVTAEKNKTKIKLIVDQWDLS